MRARRDHTRFGARGYRARRPEAWRRGTGPFSRHRRSRRLNRKWLTRGQGADRGAYFASQVAFLLSLAFAIALDVQRLFFVLNIVSVITLFFVIHGTFGVWTYRRTGHPFVAAFAKAIAFAWAIGVTFPLLAGS